MSILSVDWITITNIEVGKLYEWLDDKPYAIRDYGRMGPLPNEFRLKSEFLECGDLFFVLNIERYTEAIWDVKILTKYGTIGWLHLWQVAKIPVKEKL